MAYFKLTSTPEHGKRSVQATEFWHEKHITSEVRPNVEIGKPLEPGLYCFKFHPEPEKGLTYGIIHSRHIRTLELC